MEYIAITRKVKRARIEIREGLLYVIAPKNINPKDVIERNQKWIELKFKRIKKAQTKIKKLTIEQRDIYEFKREVFELVELYKCELRVNINKINFRKMRRRWGSCNIKGDITINTNAKDLPLILLEYLVYHEVAHKKELNHSKKFWSIISQRFPNYKELSFMLKMWNVKDCDCAIY